MTERRENSNARKQAITHRFTYTKLGTSFRRLKNTEGETALANFQYFSKCTGIRICLLLHFILFSLAGFYSPGNRILEKV
jgi:hypothetical protein